MTTAPYVYSNSPSPIADPVVAFFSTDFEGTVTSWNGTSETLLGWTAADAIGQPPPFIGPESAELWRHICRCVTFGASVRDVEIDAVTSDGRTIPIRVSCGPNRGSSAENETVLHIVCRPRGRVSQGNGG